MNQFERDISLTEGTWKNTLDNTIHKGNTTIKAKASIDHIPVFEKLKMKPIKQLTNRLAVFIILFVFHIDLQSINPQFPQQVLLQQTT